MNYGNALSLLCVLLFFFVLSVKVKNSQTQQIFPKLLSGERKLPLIEESSS